MDESQDEFQDSTPDEVQIQDTEFETAESEAEDPKDQKIADLESKNKQLYERVKKAEKPTENQLTNSPSNADERFERLELRTEGYNSEEVDFLMRNGGRQALDDKIVMAGIDSIRKQTKSQSATPSASGRSPIYQRFTAQDLRNMPLDELEKILPRA